MKATTNKKLNNKIRMQCTTKEIIHPFLHKDFGAGKFKVSSLSLCELATITKPRHIMKGTLKIYFYFYIKIPRVCGMCTQKNGLKMRFNKGSSLMSFKLSEIMT